MMTVSSRIWATASHVPGLGVAGPSRMPHTTASIRSLQTFAAVRPPPPLSRLPLTSKSRPSSSLSTLANKTPSSAFAHQHSLAALIPRRNASTATAPSPPKSPQYSNSPPPQPDPDSSSNSESGPEEKSKSAYARFKDLSKKYGWWAVGMYFALSLVDFSLTLSVVHAVGAERIEPLVLPLIHEYRVLRYGEEEAIRLDKESEEKAAEERAKELELRKLSPEERKKVQGSTNTFGSKTFWAEVALAYTIHKVLLLPFRAGLTVAWTPKLVKWLTTRGWVGKGGFGRAAEHAQGKIRHASHRVRASAKEGRRRRAERKAAKEHSR